ncbi:hypothetical protein HYC85_009709 [Camellia sinensis]|uniref:Uncharacterized protein n=1 Tax=Camellia sinensis TaxID=4442 RepID=A0A7J7HGN1_CAMSI|nr:hypothetical protein HYC85_009709 [Camellia sinensis]
MVQQGQRPGGRRAGGVPGQQGQQPVPLMQQQPPGRGMPGVPGGMLSIPYDMGGMPLHDGGMSQPIPIGALASALANASPADQRTTVGEDTERWCHNVEEDTGWWCHNVVEDTGWRCQTDVEDSL